MKYAVNTGRIALLLITLLLLSLGTLKAHAATPTAWQIELCGCLNEMMSGTFYTALSDGALEQNALALESHIAIPTIFELFVRGTHDIELFWWKHENRAARCFAMALYLCATDEGPAWMPDFEFSIERFNEEERQERSEEHAFILEYRSALARKIAQILQKRDSEKYHSEYKVYFGAMGRFWFTKPLPGWCKNATIEHVDNAE